LSWRFLFISKLNLFAEIITLKKLPDKIRKSESFDGRNRKYASTTNAGIWEIEDTRILPQGIFYSLCCVLF